MIDPAETLRILFVDDDPLDVQVAEQELARHGLKFSSRIAASESAVKEQLEAFLPDVVLCDHTMPAFPFPQALDALRRMLPTTPIVIMTETIADDDAVELVKHGATDYVLKSNLCRLGPAVRRVVVETRQRLALEARILGMEHYDTLTGLQNLSHLNEIVGESFERARRTHGLAAVVVVNLDKFRYVDEVLGRADADAVLRDVSGVLTARSRGFDFVARIGPNEFLLTMSSFDRASAVNAAIDRILKDLAIPRTVKGREVCISASAGAALYPSDGESFEELRCKAAVAMYEAKAQYPGSLQLHSSELVQRAYGRRHLESRLRHALQGQELTLFYQPQFDLASGRCCGVEALARWPQPIGEPIAPAVFIPLAENTGQIEALGAWALQSGCGTAVKWPDVKSSRITVSINVSPGQVGPALATQIVQALDRSGLTGESLELEITAGIFQANMDLAVECLREWKNLGIRIALDDYGTGYSSVSNLSKLPVDRLKIDCSLIRGLTCGSKDTTDVRSVISMGRKLGITVLAKGVETEEQLLILQNLGCRQGQGYLFARPLPAHAAAPFMGERWGARGRVADSKSRLGTTATG